MGKKTESKELWTEEEEERKGMNLVRIKTGIYTFL